MFWCSGECECCKVWPGIGLGQGGDSGSVEEADVTGFNIKLCGDQTVSF